MRQRFPDCEIIHCEQRTPEWFEARRGNLTASKVGPWVMEAKKFCLNTKEVKEKLDELQIDYKKSGKNKDYYINLLPEEVREASYKESKEYRKEGWKLVNSIAEGWESPTRQNAAMERGAELEPEAVAAFEKATGEVIEEVGFCKSLHGRFGCSPDGLLSGKNVGFEGKVLIPENHLFYWEDKRIPSEYIMQVHMCMAVTGAEAWWFQLWNPEMPAFRTLVNRCDYTEKLLDALKRFSESTDERIAQFLKAYQEEVV